VVGVACAATVATGWHSPVRVALAIGFLLFGPGLALAELLDVRDPFTRLAVATGASLAVDTIVALILVYAGAFSTLLALVLLLLVTVCAAVGTVLRPGPTNGFAVEQSRRDP
jgi:hypothetical protein